LFRKVLAFVESDEDIRARAFDANMIVQYIAPYIQHVVNYFKTATENDIAVFRGRIARSGVDYNCLQMMAIIHHADQSFETRELTEWISKQDVEGTKEARSLIDEIQQIIFDDVVTKLQSKHGTARNAWWERGIPQGIRVATYERFTKENDGREMHQFLTLSNYPEVLQYEGNWDLFKDYYSFPRR
jgi:DNA sulfur modification protein DndB